MPTSALTTAPQASRFADRAAAARAIDMVLPSIEAAMKIPRCGDSGCLHIVVMDPVRAPGSCRFEEAILCERSLGRPDQWDADYAGLARAKAQLSWQHGMDSHTVQTCRPHLLQRGDVSLWGSVSLDGIVVAMSGFHPWYDEAFSCAIAACLRALARDVRDRGETALFIA